MEAFDTLLRETLLVTAVLCIPILLLTATIGTLIAVVQAATQVQEQTLALLPKIVAVGTAVALFGAFGMRMCAALFADVLAHLPGLVRG